MLLGLLLGSELTEFIEIDLDLGLSGNGFSGIGKSKNGGEALGGLGNFWVHCLIGGDFGKIASNAKGGFQCIGFFLGVQ